MQSLSVVVPNSKCINDCAFCVSKMHCDQFPNLMNIHSPQFDLSMRDYIKRLEFARHNGCNTVMLTGTSEPQQNRTFLILFGMFMQMMKDPFEWIEMQTTGVLLTQEYLRQLRNHVGVNLISLSLSALEDTENLRIMGCPAGERFALATLAHNIKDEGFSLRLSLNLTSHFDKYQDCPEKLFLDCKTLGANQVTLRVLYSDEGDSPQAKWIKANAAMPSTVNSIYNHILLNGRYLGTLPYGAKKYSVAGMSVVLDEDCMAKDRTPDSDRTEDPENYKYLILRPDCRLYSQWDDPASLIF